LHAPAVLEHKTLRESEAGGAMAESPDIAALLEAAGRAERGAMDELVRVIYPDLRRIAHFHLVKERPGHTLNTTAIVHEAYLRLAAGSPNWNDQRHFLRAASAVMRHLLVDHARQREAAKRGSGLRAVTLTDTGPATEDDSVAVIALDDALKDLARIDPRLEQVMECRYFAGLTVGETAEALGMSERTVEREVLRARGYLRRAMQADDG
jgi:RNA polymerase sigma factor (TIGR02999 family)